MNIDVDIQKQLTITNNIKRIYMAIKEVRDHLMEKKEILVITYTTLRRDIHTRKQMHKMNNLRQMMSKKRN